MKARSQKKIYYKLTNQGQFDLSLNDQDKFVLKQIALLPEMKFFKLSFPLDSAKGFIKVNKKPSSFLKRVQLVFTIPEHNPIGERVFHKLFYSTATAPSTNTVTLLFNTSTKPACMSKFAK